MAALVATVLLPGFTPHPDDDLESHPEVASNDDAAMADADALMAADGPRNLLR